MNVNDKWKMMVNKLSSIDSLRKEIEDNEDVNIEEIEIVGKGLNGKILNNLVEVESFLREVIKESRI